MKRVTQDNKSVVESNKPTMLCCRCQRRVNWIERKQGFRCECQHPQELSPELQDAWIAFGRHCVRKAKRGASRRYYANIRPAIIRAAIREITKMLLDWNRQVWTCYGFVPIKPVTMAKTDKDPRSILAPAMFAARAHITDYAKAHLAAKKQRKGVVLYWEVERK